MPLRGEIRQRKCSALWRGSRVDVVLVLVLVLVLILTAALIRGRERGRGRGRNISAGLPSSSRLEMPDRVISSEKAAEGAAVQDLAERWCAQSARSVLDCGGPPPLSSTADATSGFFSVYGARGFKNFVPFVSFCSKSFLRVILRRVMQTDLNGKVVVVTGASGGIGSAIARQFAAEGARLVLQYRRGRERAEALRRELAGAETLLVRADLTKETDARKLFSAAAKTVRPRRYARRQRRVMGDTGHSVARDVAATMARDTRQRVDLDVSQRAGIFQIGGKAASRQRGARRVDRRCVRRSRPRGLRRGEIGAGLWVDANVEE